MDQTWRTLNSVTLRKDRWIDLRADHCVTPGGVELNPYYVLAYPDWVHVVALTDDDHVVLVRQYRHAVGKILVELPGGAVDAPDASVEQAARRELEEETGFTAARWQKVTSFYPNPATHTNQLHILLATGVTRRSSQRLDAGEEGLEVVTFPTKDVLAGLGTGLIGHAMHVSGLLLGLALAGRIRLDPTLV